MSMFWSIDLSFGCTQEQYYHPKRWVFSLFFSELATFAKMQTGLDLQCLSRLLGSDDPSVIIDQSLFRFLRVFALWQVKKKTTIVTTGFVWFCSFFLLPVEFFWVPFFENALDFVFARHRKSRHKFCLYRENKRNKEHRHMLGTHISEPTLTVLSVKRQGRSNHNDVIMQQIN